MKRVAVILGFAAALPAPAALAQIPPAPAEPARAAPPPAPGPAPSPAPAPAPPPPTPPEAPEATPPGEASPPVAESAPAPPGDQYYVEKPGALPPQPPQPPQPPPFEPPVPGRPYEPPPPPQPSHLAPRNSLWLGARLGWFVPFGNVWARGVARGPDAGRYYYLLEGQPWRDYASSGPMFELNAGVRLSRSYTAFLLWERAQLGSGDYQNGPDRAQDGAETDFWAVGLRATSDPNRIGFITEVAIGFRRARTFFENDVEYQFTDAPFEARLGLGAEYRLNRVNTFSLLATVGVGGFGSVERIDGNDQASPLTGPFDEGDGHAWATINLAAHFDLLGSRK